MTRFFRLTSSFFGLNSEYKVPLLDEIFVCMRHLKVPYTDVLNMATYERRYFLTSLINENQKKQEHMENQNATTSNGNGKRTTKVGGEQLKSKLMNGSLPNQ